MKFEKFLKGKNSIKLIVMFAFIGIAFIALSEFIPKKETVKLEENNQNYDEYLEDKLIEIVSSITGELSPKVMVALSSTNEYIYATEKNEKIEQGDNINTKESEEKYIIIENSDGEKALLITELEPQIKGVVVSTKYSGNIMVKESIINAITTVLDLPSNKVCVVGKIK